MEFGLAITSNLNLEQNRAIQELSDEMSSFFSGKDYGSGVKSYIIGVVCVEAGIRKIF